MYQIDLIETVEEIITIRDVWLQILDNQENPLLNCHPDLIINSMKSNKVAIFVIKNNNIIEAIAPCFFIESSFKFRLGLLKFGGFKQNKLTLIGDDLLYSTKSNKDNCVGEFVNNLHQHNLMDIFSVEVVPGSSPLFLFLKNSAEWSISHAATNNIVRQILMPDSHEEYLSSMKRKVRYNIKRSVKQITEAFDGDIELKIYTQENHVEELLEKVDLIFKKCWQSNVMGYYDRNAPSIIQSKKDLAKKNWLKCYILECKGSPVAYVIGSQFNGYFEYEETGFDPKYSQYSPGSVMTYILIETLFKESKPNVLSFGYGENVYKKIFGNHYFSAYNILVCHKSSKANILLKIQSYLNKTYGIISAVLVKIKLDTFIRKTLKKK